MSKNYEYDSFAKSSDEELVENEKVIFEPAKEELTVEEPKVEKKPVESPVKEEKVQVKPFQAKSAKRKGKVIVVMGDGRVIVSYEGQNYFVDSDAKFGDEIEF